MMFFKQSLIRTFHRSMMMKSKVQLENKTSSYVKYGKNEKNPCLLLPGALGFVESDFEPLLKRFNEEKYQLICWDPPGYGDSRPPDRTWGDGKSTFYHSDARMADLLMQKLGYNRYNAFGWSDGGITALIMAGQYQNSINKLVVWGANAYVCDHDIELYSKVADINDWSERMRKPMVDKYGAEYFQNLWSQWIDAMKWIKEHKNGDLCQDLLSQILCPTLIIHGSKDAMVPDEHPLLLKEKIANSQLHILPEGKHNLHLKYGEEFVSIIDKFVL